MTTKKEFTCSVCGKIVLRYDCQNKKSGVVYCSKVCLGLSKRHGSAMYCAYCDKPFYRRFGEQGNTVNQFCSNPCYSAYRNEMRNGTYPKIGPDHRHRIVAESVLGRSLKKGEVIHHKDNDKANFSPENLCVIPNQSIHASIHFGKTDCFQYDLAKVADNEKAVKNMLAST